MPIEHKTVRQTLAFALCNKVLVLVHGDQNPSPSDWKAYESVFRANLGHFDALLVDTPGPGPNANQRRSISELGINSPVEVKTAVLTPSDLARGIVTALSWRGNKISAFAPERRDQALRFLDVQTDSYDEILELIEEMRDQLASSS
jgi:hypothetical protein